MTVTNPNMQVGAKLVTANGGSRRELVIVQVIVNKTNAYAIAENSTGERFKLRMVKPKTSGWQSAARADRRQFVFAAWNRKGIPGVTCHKCEDQHLDQSAFTLFPAE